MRHLFLFLILFLVSVHLPAQCEINNTAFMPGEKLQFKVVYNWGFIWVEAGEVEFSVSKADYNNNPAYYFKAYGRSIGSYDKLFKVRDIYKSYATRENLKSLKYVRDTYEGGYKVDNTFYFDYHNKKARCETKNSEDGAKKNIIDIEQCTRDLLTSVYYARNLNFSDFQINQKIPFSVVIDGELFDLYARYLGKETVELKDGRLYRCHKFSTLLVEGTIFKGGEDLTVWITDDQNRIPVLVNAKILIGSVKAVLTKTYGLRNKSSARVK
jgi:hypothetical protein